MGLGPPLFQGVLCSHTLSSSIPLPHAGVRPVRLMCLTLLLVLVWLLIYIIRYTCYNHADYFTIWLQF